MLPMALVLVILMVPSYLASNSNQYYYGAAHMFGENTRLGADTAAIEETFGRSDTYVVLVPEGDTATQQKLSDALHAIPYAAHRNAAAVGCLRCGGGRHRYGVPCIRQHRCPLRLGVRGKRDIQRKAIPPGAALEMQSLHAIAGFGAKAQHTHGAAKNFRVISFQFNFVGHSIPPYDPFEPW